MAITIAVINTRFVKPLETELIVPLAQRIGKVVTLEEGYLIREFDERELMDNW